ncbi:location of vulva defective 1-like [Labrus mixtus]|uniref:location of vulva defective 1-like n=1 Tax=Labrus mixtus TaxID=508554 RepID=UPI0029C0604A|nr:location of vulva defective 1-like [Labrus mixtus]XP_060905105.1 location of vulva defective 1-like [Labrus mixtus]
MKLGLLVVMAVVVLVPSMSEGRIVSKCELKEKLWKSNILPKCFPNQHKEHILAMVICELNRRYHLNTSKVVVFGQRETTSEEISSEEMMIDDLQETTSEEVITDDLQETTTEEMSSEEVITDDLQETTTAEMSSEEVITDDLQETTTEEMSSEEVITDDLQETTTAEMSSEEMITDDLQETTTTTPTMETTEAMTTKTTTTTTPTMETTEAMTTKTTTTTTPTMETTEAMTTKTTTTKKMSSEEIQKTTTQPIQTTLEAGKKRRKREAGNCKEYDLAMDLYGMVNTLESIYDEEIIMKAENKINDEDDDSNEAFGDMLDSEESGKSEAGAFRIPKKTKLWSLGHYGVFHLSDGYHCNSDYRLSVNKCNTSCNAFADDDITDDIDCFVKTEAWRQFFYYSSSECSDPKDYFKGCR